MANPTSSSLLGRCIDPRRWSPSRQLTFWVHRRGLFANTSPVWSLPRLQVVLTLGFLHTPNAHPCKPAPVPPGYGSEYFTRGLPGSFTTEAFLKCFLPRGCTVADVTHLFIIQSLQNPSSTPETGSRRLMQGDVHSMYICTRVENDVQIETRDAEGARDTKSINLCSGARKVG